MIEDSDITAAVAVGTAVAPVVKQGYEDLIQPIVQPIGKTLGAIPRLLYATAGLPIDAFVRRREQYWQRVQDELKNQVDAIPQEQRVEPKLDVLSAAQLGLYSSVDSQSLYTLFVTLITKSMDRKTQKQILPVYADVLRQLTPDEVKIIGSIFNQNKQIYPIIAVYANYKSKPSSGQCLLKNFSLLCLSCDVVANYYVYIDNLVRLNLISIDMLRYITTEGAYKDLESNRAVDSLREKIEKMPDRTFVIKKGILELTAFGSAFCEACNMKSYYEAIK